MSSRPDTAGAIIGEARLECDTRVRVLDSQSSNDAASRRRAFSVAANSASSLAVRVSLKVRGRGSGPLLLLQSR